MSKNVIISARGKKVNLAALKAANPNVKPVRNTPKGKKVSEKKKTEMPKASSYLPKLSGTSPSPRPKPIVVNVDVDDLPSSEILPAIKELMNDLNDSGVINEDDWNIEENTKEMLHVAIKKNKKDA